MRSPSAGLLRKFLEQRVHDLRLLGCDLECAQFSSDAPDAPDAPVRSKLLVAVDWSEVFAYIMADSPPGADPLVKLMGERGRMFAVSAHQVALLMLFERLTSFGVPLVLLPPYVREFEHFVRLVQERVLSSTASAKVQEELLRGIHEEPDMKALVEIAKRSVLGRTEDERYTAFRAAVEREFSFERIEQLVERKFGVLLRSALLSNRSVVKVLRHLLGDADGSSARLKGLADVLPQLKTQGLRPDLLRSKYWESRLESDLNKPPMSRMRDAHALALLEQLNPLVHDAGYQLVFVTRSHDLIASMDDAPERFSCLSHAYVTDRVARDAERPHLITRSWRAFLELGLAVQGTDFASARHVVRERRAATESRLAALDSKGGRSERSRKLVETEELSDQVHNTKQMLSTEAPWLQHTPDTSHFAIKLFVKCVTDPWDFADARRRVRDRLLQEVEKVQFSALLTHEGWSFDAAFDRSPQFSPITRSALRDFPEGIDIGIHPELRSHLLTVQRSFASPDGGPSEAWHRLHEQLRRTVAAGVAKGADSELAPDAAALLTLAAYRRGAMDTAGYLVVRFRDVLNRARKGSAAWLIYRLIRADLRLAEGLPWKAAEIMADSRRELRDVRPVGARDGAASDSLRRMLFYSAGLLLHLDWADTCAERMESFPESPHGPEKFALADWCDDLSGAVRAADAHLTPKLRAKVYNNLIYAAARLAPIYEDWAVPQWYAFEPRFQHVYRRLMHDPESTERVRFLERRGADRTEDETDTLAYHSIKLGYWRGGTKSPEGRRMYGDAAKLLGILQRRADKKSPPLSPRVKTAIRSHKELLERLRQLASRPD